jgi:hypothetical protein
VELPELVLVLRAASRLGCPPRQRVPVNREVAEDELDALAIARQDLRERGQDLLAVGTVAVRKLNDRQGRISRAAERRAFIDHDLDAGGS